MFVEDSETPNVKNCEMPHSRRKNCQIKSFVEIESISIYGVLLLSFDDNFQSFLTVYGKKRVSRKECKQQNSNDQQLMSRRSHVLNQRMKGL